MSDMGSSHEKLVMGLVEDLHPVQVLRPPWQRALAWLAIVLVVALVLAYFADMPAVEHRLMATPDMWLAVVGSALTAGLAAVAAFELALPDRSPHWVWLPMPALALWIGASGLGCARTLLIPGADAASPGDSMHCLRFIIGLSVPLSLLILLMLRRGYSMLPTMMGAMAGLAVAAAAATLLVFFHPFDATVTDLSVHAAAVTVVVIANRLLAKSFARIGDTSAGEARGFS